MVDLQQFSDYVYRYPDAQSIDQTLKVLEIRIQSIVADEINFDIIGLKPFFANTIRQLILNEIPTMAIEDVYFQKNTFTFFNCDYISQHEGIVCRLHCVKGRIKSSFPAGVIETKIRPNGQIIPVVAMNAWIIIQEVKYYCDHLIFIVETYGVKDPAEMFINALDIFKYKIEIWKKRIQKVKSEPEKNNRKMTPLVPDYYLIFFKLVNFP
ncbi:DNA-directed RNA polymerases I and III subunit RPAC1 [Dermatophagoides farinae]|uniref:DNA-directed RNA polymerases I and III subunit RPAC1 n=1 Tax=Dermatophagoides farinae TaxID=6954 RepID=A0A922HVL7_DERFA|nr:DNA-directed RNA polymerases I and III subunit RPAC1 [Dermatophagoides farinae]